MRMHQTADGFVMEWQGRTVLTHSQAEPCLWVGTGVPAISQQIGDTKIEDTLTEKRAMRLFTCQPERGTSSSATGPDGDVPACDIRFQMGDITVTLHTTEEDGRLVFTPEVTSHEADEVNRFWLRLPSERGEMVYGLGEQFSYFNLRGHHFPIWVREGGVGRNKRTLETFLADAAAGGGGDYHHTYFPQPTFLSSDRYYVHVDASFYMDFDFRHHQWHQVEVWGLPKRIVIGQAETFPALVSNLSNFLGRQPALPDWAVDGVWLGLQGGVETVNQKLTRAREAGVPVRAVWVQDWEGRRVTEFGSQLWWNWRADEKTYPNLKDHIASWKQDDVRFLGYINGFLVPEGHLYEEAAEHGYLVKNQSGGVYHVVVTTFPAALVDYTNPQAVDWLKNVIKEEMLSLGMDGWMADFGEYLPADAVLYSGEDPLELHNQWPVLQAKVHREVLVDAGQGDAVFFTRSGYAGISRYSPLVWAGDQNVDWTKDDGLPSVIPAALSSGLLGIGFHHSDIGGYTSYFHVGRTKELFMRWTEQAAFTVVMRTHEGNRPGNSWQFDSDEETLQHFARMTQIHHQLAPYTKSLVTKYTESGLPAVRPLFLHEPDDESSFTLQDTYLFGPDVLVAPVLQRAERMRSVHLPSDGWTHLWSLKEYGRGDTEVPAPLGYPPVFYRSDSEFRDLFTQIGEEFGADFLAKASAAANDDFRALNHVSIDPGDLAQFTKATGIDIMELFR